MTRTAIAIGVVLVIASISGGYWWGSRHGVTPQMAPQRPDGAAAQVSRDSGKRKILYYRHPMGLPDTSPVPKTDSMGMAYVPVYADEVPEGPGFLIPAEKLQRIGVSTVAAGPKTLARSIRAVGTVQIDERRQTAVAPKFEGYVTQLYVATTGVPVRRGQPLLALYSPDIVSAQEELRIAQRNQARFKDAAPEVRERLERLVEASHSRLRNWGIAARDVPVTEERPAPNGVVLRSPVDGVVIEKLVRVGQRFMPGEALYQVANLDKVWVVANVFEQDVAALAPGTRARATFDAYPGQLFEGRVALVYPTLETETRTLAVRIELANPTGILKPGLYGSVEILGPSMTVPVTVPESAVLDSGTRQLVFVARGGGRFEAREVKLGVRAGGVAAVIQGLAAGEPVVVDGNFLIDAESNLRAGTQALGHAHGAAAPTGDSAVNPPSPPAEAEAGEAAHGAHSPR